MTYDSAAWGALALGLSLVLGVVTFFRWRRLGLAAGLRGAAWTILPVAAWLTGLLELAFDIGSSIGDWALHLVFSPVVWLGIVLTGVAGLLFGASALLTRRGPAPVRAGNQRPAVGRGETAGAQIDDDLAEIEAILRKRGIS